MATLLVMATLAPIAALPFTTAATGPGILVDPEGDNLNGGGGASDVVRLGATTDEFDLHLYVEVAGADHPKLIQYRVSFTHNATSFEAITSYTTDGSFTSSFVNGQPISAELVGNEVHLSIPRAHIGSPTVGENLTDVVVTTRHGASGSTFDGTGAGTYRVGNSNAPALAPIGPQTGNENELIEFTVDATDGDGDALQYSHSDLPEGATFNATTNVFSWTPTFEQAGEYLITFEVTDGSTPVTEDVTITVAHVNRAPELAELPDVSVNETDVISFTVSASDADGDAVTLGSGTLPEGASFDNATGLFEWTTTYDDAGLHDVTFTATDGNATASKTVTVTIGNVNRAPVLEPIGDQTVAEADLLEFNVTAEDLDGDVVTLTIDGLPTGAEHNATTSLVTWTPSYDQAGAYPVWVNVTDGDLWTNESFTITAVNVNRAPLLDPVGGRSVLENQTLAFELNASDADGENLTFSADGLPAGATLNATSGEFEWTPAFDQSGMHNVTFFVTDGDLADNETVSIVVGNVNRAPVFTQIGPQNVSETATLDLVVSATDPDGDEVTLDSGALPIGAEFNATTGEFTWTPSYDQAGEHTLTFTAADGMLSTPMDVTITVTNLNRPPVVESVDPVAVNETESVAFTLNATDADNDTMAYASAVDLPDGATLDALTGEFTWTPTFDQAGAYLLDLVVSDGEDNTTVSIEITVVNVNRAPLLEPIGDQSISEGDVLNFTVVASDPDGELLTLTTEVLPAGATLDPATNNVTWETDRRDGGVYFVKFTVSDGELSTNETITITVVDPDVPEFQPLGTEFTSEGQALSFVVSATDGDGDPIVYGASDLPEGATLDAASGAFDWTPTYHQSGDYSFNVSAFDGYSTVTGSVTIHVLEDNGPPKLALIGTQVVGDNAFLTFTATATDPDDDALTFSASGLPDGATFDNETGVFAWTPTFEQIGEHNVTVSVTDGSFTDSEDVSIHVQNTNRGPIAGMKAPGVVRAGANVQFTSTSVDPDGQPLAHAWDFGDGSTSDVKNPTHAFATGGTFTVTLTVTDIRGVEATESAVIKSDDGPPVTVATVDGSGTDDGWYDGSVRVTLDAVDVGSAGVKLTRFALDANPQFSAYPLEGIALPSGSAEHTVRFFSEDNVGNREEEQTVNVKVDTVAPVPKLKRELGNVLVGPTTLSATATDSGSGLAQVDFLVDGEVLCSDTDGTDGWTCAYAPETGVEQRTVSVEAHDRVGNVGTDSQSVVVVAFP